MFSVQLVAAGRRPHELTVDLIYAEIRQGSRTTINDELKLWKDEQTKVDALSAALPPAVANAMLNVWGAAVEHGEAVFQQRREEVEVQLQQAQSLAEAVTLERAALAAQVAELQGKLDARAIELQHCANDIAQERGAKELALERALTAEQEKTELRRASEAQAATMRKTHDETVTGLHSEISAKEQEFRIELGRATERLESVQKHVMLQVSEAREAHKRAEGQLVKAQQKNEQLGVERQQLRAETIALTGQLRQAGAASEETRKESMQLRDERDELLQRLAGANGKLEVMTQQASDAEQRALRAEQALRQPQKRTGRRAVG